MCLIVLIVSAGERSNAGWSGAGGTRGVDDGMHVGDGRGWGGGGARVGDQCNEVEYGLTLCAGRPMLCERSTPLHPGGSHAVESAYSGHLVWTLSLWHRCTHSPRRDGYRSRSGHDALEAAGLFGDGSDGQVFFSSSGSLRHPSTRASRLHGRYTHHGLWRLWSVSPGQQVLSIKPVAEAGTWELEHVQSYASGNITLDPLAHSYSHRGRRRCPSVVVPEYTECHGEIRV